MPKFRVILANIGTARERPGFSVRAWEGEADNPFDAVGLAFLANCSPNSPDSRHVHDMARLTSKGHIVVRSIERLETVTTTKYVPIPLT